MSKWVHTASLRLLIVTLSIILTSELAFGARPLCVQMHERGLLDVLESPSKKTRKAFDQQNLLRPIAARFERQLNSLFSILKGKYGREAAEALVDENARDTLYHLDALIRSYRDSDLVDGKSRKRLHESKQKINALSRMIGATNDANKYYKFAKKSGTPQPALDVLKENRKFRRADLETFLSSQNWFAGKPDLLKDLSKVILDLSNIKRNKDATAMVTGVVEYLQEIRDSDILTEVEIGKSISLRPGEWFEEGPHQARKELRRLIAKINALGGLFQLENSPCPVEEFNHLPLDESSPAVMKFTSNLGPDPSAKKIIYLNRGLILGLIYYVRLLGETKDLVQAQHAIGWALATSGVTSTRKAGEAAEAIVKRHLKYQDPQITEKIRSTRVLDLLLQQIQRQL
jgi:hypothetical protein